MKRIALTIIAICCFFFFIAEIIVSELSARELQAAEYTIGSIQFSRSWMYLVAADGTILGQEQISNIRSIVLLNETGISAIWDSNSIKVYPNPTHDVLYIDKDEVSQYRIYNLDGQCIMNGEGNQISVSSLSAGTYLLQINTKIIKFIKQ